MDGEGLLNEELPNCWECPKCYQEDSSEKAQVRGFYPDLYCEKKGSIKLRGWLYVCLCNLIHMVFLTQGFFFFNFKKIFLLVN